MTYLLCFIIVLVSACSASPEPSLEPKLPSAPSPIPGTSATDEVLERILLEWEALNGPVQTPISFTDVEDPQVLGVCITWEPNTPRERKEIRLDLPNFQKRMSNYVAIRTIVVHELGHCDLDRPHVGDLTRSDSGESLPYSIMYPSLWPRPSIYETFKDHYVTELFTLEGTLPRIPAIAQPYTRLEIVEENGYTGVAIYD